MKKTLTYCFGSLLCLMTLASCQNGGSCCGQAATDVDLTGRLYPKVKTPTKSLVIVDLHEFAVFRRDKRKVRCRIADEQPIHCADTPVFVVDVNHTAFLYCRNYHIFIVFPCKVTEHIFIFFLTGSKHY